jgi:hypothetical protein
MAEMFLGMAGQRAFYAVLVLYLFGDLSIYAVAGMSVVVPLFVPWVLCTFLWLVVVCPISALFPVPRSLVAVTGGITLFGNALTEAETFTLYTIMFGMLVVPFAWFNLAKTKYLQYFTLLIRCAAELRDLRGECGTSCYLVLH